MQKSTKAALYSALILPGAGLLWLKQYRSGLIYLGPSLIAATYYFRMSMEIAGQVSDKLVDGSLPLDPAAVSDFIDKMMSQPGSYANEAKWVFIICWCVSVVASYLAGKKLDLPNAENK